MNTKIFNYFEIAAKIAIGKKDLRSYLLGSIGIRKDGAIVKSVNSPTDIPNFRLHSEFKLLRKMDYEGIVYVTRIKLLDGKFGMARPCFTCRRALFSKRIVKVYYTINEDQYGVWFPKTNTDRVFWM